MTYRADSLYLDLLDLARVDGSFVEMKGAATPEKCDDLATMQPVSFMTEESVVEGSPWSVDTATGLRSLQFGLRTNEPNGLVVYGFGQRSASDFFGLEIIEGQFIKVDWNKDL